MANAAEKTALGLDPDADEGTVLAKIAELSEGAEGVATLDVLEALGLTEEASEEDVLSRIGELDKSPYAVATPDVLEALNLDAGASREDALASIESLKAQAEGGQGEGDKPDASALAQVLTTLTGTPDGETTSVVIRHKAFAYRVLIDSPTDPAKKVYAERLAKRGERVDVLEDDLARGQAHDAFETPETRAADTAREIDIDEVSDGDLIRLIKDSGITVNQTLALAANDPAKAQRLLQAENGATGNDPRVGVIDGLTRIIEQTQ